MHPGRETGGTPLRQLRLGEPLEIVVSKRTEERVTRVLRLHEHAAALLATSGATGDLGEDREQPLRGTIVGRYEGRVGVQYADQRETGEVVSFGEQLRADKDVGFAAADGIQRGDQGVAPPSAIAIDAHDTGIWESLGERLLDALGAAPHRLQVDVPAGG